MGQPGLFLFIFVLFKHTFYWRDSNSDRRNRRRARWPLDNHHDPISILRLKQWLYFFIFQTSTETRRSSRSCEILFSFKLKPTFSVDDTEAMTSSAEGDVCSKDVVVYHKTSHQTPSKMSQKQLSSSFKTSHQTPSRMSQQTSTTLSVSKWHRSLYEIPPPNYKYDPTLSREKLLWTKNVAKSSLVNVPRNAA